MSKKIKEIAKNMNIRPMECDGEKFFLMSVHPQTHYKLKVHCARAKYKHDRWLERYNRWRESQRARRQHFDQIVKNILSQIDKMSRKRLTSQKGTTIFCPECSGQPLFQIYEDNQIFCPHCELIIELKVISQLGIQND